MYSLAGAALVVTLSLSLSVLGPMVGIHSALVHIESHPGWPRF